MDETDEIILNDKNNLNTINFNNSNISNIVKNSDESKEKSNSEIKEAGKLKSQLLRDNQNCLKIINTDSFLEILGVKEDSPDIIIRKNYKQKSIEFHPENNLSQFSYEAFNKISVAFQNLTKSKKFSVKLNGSIIDAFKCFELFISNKNMKNSEININDKTLINPPNWENNSISTIEIEKLEKLNKENLATIHNNTVMDNKIKVERKSENEDEIINSLNEIKSSMNNTPCSKLVNKPACKDDIKLKENQISSNVIKSKSIELVNEISTKKLIFSKKLKERIPDFLIKNETKSKHENKNINVDSNDKENKANEKKVRPPGDKTNKIIDDIVERNAKKRKTKRFLAKLIPAFIVFLYFLIQYLLKKVGILKFRKLIIILIVTEAYLNLKSKLFSIK